MVQRSARCASVRTHTCTRTRVDPSNTAAASSCSAEKAGSLPGLFRECPLRSKTEDEGLAGAAPSNLCLLYFAAFSFIPFHSALTPSHPKLC